MYQDIIHVNGDVALVDEFSKYEIHHGLEGGQHIHETKEHDHGFKKAPVGLEGCFPLITITNSDIIITPMDI